VRVDSEATSRRPGHRSPGRGRLIVGRIGGSLLFENKWSVWRKTDKNKPHPVGTEFMTTPDSDLDPANIGNARDHGIMVVFAYSWGVDAGVGASKDRAHEGQRRQRSSCSGSSFSYRGGEGSIVSGRLGDYGRWI